MGVEVVEVLYDLIQVLLEVGQEVAEVILVVLCHC